MTETGKGRLKGIRVGFIGAGAMGGAIIRGLVAGGGGPGKPDLFRSGPGADRASWLS